MLPHHLKRNNAMLRSYTIKTVDGFSSDLVALQNVVIDGRTYLLHVGTRFRAGFDSVSCFHFDSEKNRFSAHMLTPENDIVRIEYDCPLSHVNLKPSKYTDYYTASDAIKYIDLAEPSRIVFVRHYNTDELDHRLADKWTLNKRLAQMPIA